MSYVEVLRAYRALTVYVGIALAVTIVALLAILQVRGHVHLGQASASHSLPFRFVVAFAVYAAVPLAIVLGNTLGRENATLPIAWTRPTGRERIALGYVAVDLAAIVVAVLVAMLGALACLAAGGVLPYLRLDGGALPSAIAGLGAAFMWYAELQVWTAASARGGAGGIRGMSAILVLVLGGLYGLRLPQPAHGIIVALNVFNPVAWYSGATTSHSGVQVTVGMSTAQAASASAAGVHRFFTSVPEPLAVAAPWIIGALAIALAIRVWTRREATR